MAHPSISAKRIRINTKEKARRRAGQNQLKTTYRVRDFSEITKARDKLRRYYSDDELKQLLEDNPRKIINL